jgi:hypothetical protein
MPGTGIRDSKCRPIVRDELGQCRAALGLLVLALSCWGLGR